MGLVKSFASFGVYIVEERSWSSEGLVRMIGMKRILGLYTNRRYKGDSIECSWLG